MHPSTRRTALPAFLCACLSACSQAKSDAADPVPVVTMMDFDILGVEAGRGFYLAKRTGGDVRIPFALDLKQVSPERYQSSERLTETSDGSVVMLDTYGSRVQASDARCTDGRETFVRVFSLKQRKELFSQLAASCLSRIEGANPVATSPDPGSFRIEGAQPKTFRVADGKVEPLL